MSTLRLLKDHPKHGRAKAVVTVPFLEARDLVAAGHAERWNGGSGQQATEAPATVPAAALEKAGKRIAELEAENKGLRAELDAAGPAAKKLEDRAAKLEAENKALAEQVAALKKAAGK